MLRLLRSPSATDGAQSHANPPADPLRAVLERAKVGDSVAQRTLLATLGPMVLKVVRAVMGANHPDVEDVFQEGMVAIHRAVHDFRGECSTVHFACRVAVMTSMNARRRNGYRARITPSIQPEVIEQHRIEGPSPDAQLEAARRREALRSLLTELPIVQAEVLCLHTVLGHTVQEVARTTGVPIDTVRSRLRAALSKLRARVHADRTLLEALRGPP